MRDEDKLVNYDHETFLVACFHSKFGIPFVRSPQVPPPDVIEFRMKFLREELDEIERALKEGDLIGAFDGLLDLTYVAKGTALLMGITPTMWLKGFDAVQTANMTKERVSSADESKRGHAFDVGKPLGWVGPEDRLKKIILGEMT